VKHQTSRSIHVYRTPRVRLGHRFVPNLIRPHLEVATQKSDRWSKLTRTATSYHPESIRLVETRLVLLTPPSVSLLAFPVPSNISPFTPLKHNGSTVLVSPPLHVIWAPSRRPKYRDRGPTTGLMCCSFMHGVVAGTRR
jgi:hypothetical protein